MSFVSYLVRPERWRQLPGDWETIFGRREGPASSPVPLVVEIGFGLGEFLARAAREESDRNFVGFEIAITPIMRAGKKLKVQGIENVRLALVNGQFALRELFSPGSVERVYTHFPCPWPKARHARRRLINRDFVGTLAAVLMPGGTFELTTDDLEYAAEAIAILDGDLFMVTGPTQVDAGPGTRYEEKWRRQGRGIYQVVAKRKTSPSPRVQQIAEGKVPHARISVKVEEEDIVRLVGLKETWPDGAFVVKEVFLTPNGRKALLRVFSTDQGFPQHYLLALVKGHAGWIVKLDGAMLPFRTPAVKRSVAAVAEALERGIV